MKKTTATTSATVTAIGSLLSLGAAALATVPAFAADKSDTEKCYGVVKAGKNDCAGAGHSCSAQAKTDASPAEFVNVPKGTCERLAGGSTTSK